MINMSASAINHIKKEIAGLCADLRQYEDEALEKSCLEDFEEFRFNLLMDLHDVCYAPDHDEIKESFDVTHAFYSRCISVELDKVFKVVIRD